MCGRTGEGKPCFESEVMSEAIDRTFASKCHTSYLKGQKLKKLPGVLKLLPLQGALLIALYPGRCPGLGASALSGRAAYKSFCNPQACCLKVSFLSKGVWSLLAKVEPDFPIHQSEDLQRIFMPYIHAVIAEKQDPNCKTISPQLEKYFFPTGKLFSHS